MRIVVARNSKELGDEAARLTAEALMTAVRTKGWARMAMTTGASQLEAIAALSKQNLPWHQIELFQVCERVGLDDDDRGSCRKALKDRFAKRIPLAKVHCMDGTEESVKRISREVSRAPIDVLMLGMGEQGQVGFNSAPADLEADAPYILTEAADQVTMTLGQMMRASRVIVCAPYAIHAENVYEVMTHRLTPMFPATVLKLHRNIDWMLDRESAARIGVELTARCNPELEEYKVFEGPTE